MKIDFNVKTKDFTMVYLAKNNLVSLSIHQQSEEFSIDCFYFRLAKAKTRAKAISALKAQRKNNGFSITSEF